jgi:hypothetical protein
MVSACLAWLSWVGGVTGGRFRLAEVVAVLAMATDLGLGLPMEHAVRACLLSTEIGRRAGLPGEELSDLYYLKLLRMLGCTADSGYYADLFGDEVAFARDTQHLDCGNPTIPRLGLPAGSDLTVPVPPASSRAGSEISRRRHHGGPSPGGRPRMGDMPRVSVRWPIVVRRPGGHPACRSRPHRAGQERRPQLSVRSARPWRAAVTPGPGRLEGEVTCLALQALVPPGERG